MNICVVIESGWIIKGIKNETASDAVKMVLRDSAIVRSWRNGKGIGGIAKAGNKDEYTLDPIGDVEIRQSKVLFEIPCEW